MGKSISQHKKKGSMSRKTKGKYGGVRRNIKSISLKKNHKKRHAISKVKPASLSALKRGTNRNLQYRYEAQRAIGGRGGNKILTGGNMTTPVNGPVGYSWDGGNVSTWPGVQGSGGAVTNGVTMSNHFSLSPNGIVVGGIDPAISTSDDQLINSSMNGGKRRKNTKRRQNNKIYKSRKYKHGQTGGFFQEIVNLGREAQSGVNSGYFSLIGKQQPISQNPYPTEGQYSSISNQNHLTIDPPNLRAIYTDANNTVAKI